jgi:hypothetical protein
MQTRPDRRVFCLECSMNVFQNMNQFQLFDSKEKQGKKPDTRSG